MYLVVTKVELRPNVLPAFQELFERRVPAVLGQRSSWKGAEMSIDREANEVVVVGYWEDRNEMREFLASPEHTTLIQDLSVHFAGTPVVSMPELVTRIG